jgi:uroporphyrinogen decarboxylase
MIAGATAAIERYSPDGIPITFDLQIEAEALGCDLIWADDNPPAVTSHPLETGSLDDLEIPGPDCGRLPVVLEAARQLTAAHPDVAFYGLITGPFTLALHLLGPNVFMMMYDDPGQVKNIMSFCRDVAVAVSGYYIEAGCDVIAVVDPMTSQIGPDHFAEFVSPYVIPVFDAIRKKDKLSSFFVCGHAEANIGEMCKCRPDNISIDENIQLSYVKDISRKYGISFGGNMQLTVCLLFGTKEDCLRNGMDCMTVGGSTGFILSPGCDIPYATPPDNIEVVTGLVQDPYQQEVAKTLMDKAHDLQINLDMSDYGKLDKVVIDIITLDSEACAPCQYMVEAVKKVMPQFEDLVIWREHKVKMKDSVEFMTALLVRNIPTICIDGEIAFVSRIPGRDELIRAIQDRLNRKTRRILKRYMAKVIVVGDGGEACEQTKQNVEVAVKELGVEMAVDYYTDPADIERYQLDDQPAVITEQTVIKSTGKVPKPEIVKEWIKSLRL